MGLKAITRLPDAAIARCELTHLERRPIDVGRALAQHAEYRAALARLGAAVEVLPPLAGAPDATFVEDVAVVLDELAVVCSMGAESRRVEPDAIVPALEQYREVVRIGLPARIDGGDVQRVGPVVLVGLSGRTDLRGVAAFRDAVAPFGYRVEAVEVTGCLHLKSACTALPDGRLLVKRDWLGDPGALSGFGIVPVPASEPLAGDILSIGGAVLMEDAHRETRRMLEAEGYEVATVDLSEFAKAEAGVTCLSLVFEAH